MDVRILDLDGSVARQPGLVRQASRVVPLCSWGPRIRLGCSWQSYRRFAEDLSTQSPHPADRPCFHFVGSGDFHHVSLALVARIERPFALVVIDNHPDWMHSIPFPHCGTWVYHAARLPNVRRIYHVGGDVDFDNSWRWLAPWAMLRQGTIRVISGVRPFHGRQWQGVPHQVLRRECQQPATRERVSKLLEVWQEELRELPVYLSLDRDVMQAEHAVVNWDSGHLHPGEVRSVIEGFVERSAGLVGADVVGDWSAVRVRGVMRRFLHWTEHPTLHIDPEQAQRRNEALNLELVDWLAQAIRESRASLERAS